MRTALDTNVISALWSSEPAASRVQHDLDSAHAQGGVVICAPVYVELLAHPAASREFVDEFLNDTGVSVDFGIDEPVWRLGAEGFTRYAARRRRSGGGGFNRLLVDFIVAAHAQIHADRLMTLDPARYRRDFPKLQLG